MRGALTLAATLLLVSTLRVDASHVSVCRDATYHLPAERGQICAGTGARPAGYACPKKGDVSAQDCHDTLPSYDGRACVAKEDAVCEVIIGETWGCVFPSVGCAALAPTPEPQCATWDFDDHDLVAMNTANRLLESISFDASQQDYDESWFVQDGPIRELYACGRKPTPAPTTPVPPITPPPTPDTPAPTPQITTPSPPTPSPTTPCPTPSPTTPCPTPSPTTPCPTPTSTTPCPTPSPTTPCPTPSPTTPCPTPSPTTPCPTPTPSSTTPCPTPTPTSTTPCPTPTPTSTVPTPCPTPSSTTPAPTPCPTPESTTPVPTPCPTTPAPMPYPNPVSQSTPNLAQQQNPSTTQTPASGNAVNGEGDSNFNEQTQYQQSAPSAGSSTLRGTPTPASNAMSVSLSAESSSATSGTPPPTIPAAIVICIVVAAVVLVVGAVKYARKRAQPMANDQFTRLQCASPASPSLPGAFPAL